MLYFPKIKIERKWETEYDSYTEARKRADDYGEALKAAGFEQKPSNLRTVRYVNSDAPLVCEMDYDAKSRQGTSLNLWFECADK